MWSSIATQQIFFLNQHAEKIFLQTTILSIESSLNFETRRQTTKLNINLSESYVTFLLKKVQIFHFF